MTEFQGFSPETIDFLWGIRFNNNREWFAEHKGEYQKYLYEPMKALAKAVAPAFEEPLKLHLSRIYRDMRMHPSTFYKESLWFCIREDGGPWLRHPCLCFEIRPEGYRYGFLYVAPASDMTLLRAKILEQPEKFLTLVKKAERDSGVPLGGDAYARPKACENEKVKKYFGLKNFIALRDCPPDDLLYSPDLIEEVKKTLLPWVPVTEFCRDF